MSADVPLTIRIPRALYDRLVAFDDAFAAREPDTESIDEDIEATVLAVLEAGIDYAELDVGIAPFCWHEYARTSRVAGNA